MLPIDLVLYDPSTLFGLLGPVLALGVGIYAYKHGGSGALTILRDANAVLGGRCEELERTVKQQSTTIGLLEARTNLEPIAASVVDQFGAHERRASERHEATLRIMEMIAERLGPDPNGGRGG